MSLQDSEKRDIARESVWFARWLVVGFGNMISSYTVFRGSSNL